MRHVGSFHSQTRRSDEPLVFWVFPRKGLSGKGDLCYDTFPGLLAALSGCLDLEHLVVGHRLDLRDGHLPLSGLFFSFLFHRVGQDLRSAHTLSIQQVGGNGSLRHGLVVLVGVRSLVVHSDGLSHRGLFLEPTLLVDLGPDTVDLLGEFGSLVDQSGLLLTHPLVVIHADPVELLVAFHVLMLRHFGGCTLRTSCTSTSCSKLLCFSWLVLLFLVSSYALVQ
mmetsp:Transcript_7622/g.16444  ORF Transcript_7622/g.16444 Transcript_7622/m.16444 type:complete len:223 (+) Transcript_7622:295-963(+)